MTAIDLLAKDISGKLYEEIDLKVKELNAQRVNPLCLTTIRIGSYSDAKWYEGAIGKICERVGVLHNIEVLQEDAGFSQIENLVNRILDTADGILLLSPLPSTLDYQKVLQIIPPDMDVEGTRYDRVVGLDIFPPTALASFEMVKASGINIEGANAVVVGRSKIVGMPVFDLLLKANATTTICHSRTRDLQDHISRADIVVAACGRPALVKGEWIKKGAVVVDAGENDVNGEPVGDVGYQKAREKAAFITPVPRGVGPLTSLMLIKNLCSLSSNKLL